MSCYVDVGPDRHRAVAGGGAHIDLTIGIELEDTGAIEIAVRRWQIAGAPVLVDVAAMRSQIDVSVFIVHMGTNCLCAPCHSGAYVRYSGCLGTCLPKRSLDPLMAVAGDNIVCQGLERLLLLLEERIRL